MAAVAVQPEPETLAGLYRQMLLIRRFEETVYYLFLEGEIPGTLHQYQGQEAVAVGICDVLRPTDWITSTHRPHGHALAKGVTPRAAMAELYGKSTGCCAGKGGSMHLGDPAVGMLPAIAIVGAGNTVVTGLGLAFKLRRTDQVAVCFFGDGASNEGAFHEGLNFAAVRRLPIVFVCENNLYGASTPFHAVSALVDVADRAAAYGIPGHVVDGMDVLAVREAGAAAVAARARRRGPDAARVQDVPLRRPQPQRRARLPGERGGGGVEGARPDPPAARRPRRADGRPAADRARGRGGDRRRGRVRARLARRRPAGGARPMSTPEAGTTRHAA